MAVDPDDDDCKESNSSCSQGEQKSRTRYQHKIHCGSTIGHEQRTERRAICTQCIVEHERGLYLEQGMMRTLAGDKVVGTLL